jgi:hypothetical protein
MCDLLLLEYGRRIYFSDHDLVVRVVNINLAISLGAHMRVWQIKRELYVLKPRFFPQLVTSTVQINNYVKGRLHPVWDDRL